MQGKTIPFVLESPPVPRAARRAYTVSPAAVGGGGGALRASVSWTDYDRNDMPLGRGGPVVAEVEPPTGMQPGEAVEEFCRRADPSAFRGRRRSVVPIAQAGAAAEAVARELERLRSPAEREDGHPAPHPGSAARVMAFARSLADLLPPLLFSSKDGTVRARWNSGAERTAFVAFPPDAPLPITVRFPRVGNYGFVQVQCRVVEDGDIPQFLAALGIRVTAS